MRILALGLPTLGLVAIAMAVGLFGAAQLSIALLVLLSVFFGLAVGIETRRAWEGGGEIGEILDEEGPAQLIRRVRGSVGALLVLAAVTVFAAIEAHALGAGIRAGAPAGSFALLVPPVAIAGFALRVATRRAR